MSEGSGKDYEAVISRAVLLKPLAHVLVSYPNIYEPEVSCVEVRPIGCTPRRTPPHLQVQGSDGGVPACPYAMQQKEWNFYSLCMQDQKTFLTL